MFLRQPLPTILHCLLGNWRRDYFGKLYGACVQSGPQKGEEHLVPYHNVAKSRDIWHMNLWGRGNQEKSVMSSKVFRVCFCRRSIALPLTSANTPGTNHPEGPRMRKVAKPALQPRSCYRFGCWPSTLWLLCNQPGERWQELPCWDGGYGPTVAF